MREEHVIVHFTFGALSSSPTRVRHVLFLLFPQTLAPAAAAAACGCARPAFGCARWRRGSRTCACRSSDNWFIMDEQGNSAAGGGSGAAGGGSGAAGGPVLHYFFETGASTSVAPALDALLPIDVTYELSDPPAQCYNSDEDDSSEGEDGAWICGRPLACALARSLPCAALMRVTPRWDRPWRPARAPEHTPVACGKRGIGIVSVQLRRAPTCRLRRGSQSDSLRAHAQGP